MTESEQGPQRAGPQDEEPAEGSRETVEEQRPPGGFSDTSGDDPTMGGTSDADTAP